MAISYCHNTCGIPKSISFNSSYIPLSSRNTAVCCGRLRAAGWVIVLGLGHELQRCVDWVIVLGLWHELQRCVDWVIVLGLWHELWRCVDWVIVLGLGHEL